MIGERRYADEIDSCRMQLFTDPEDIEWALGVHVQSQLKFRVCNTTGIILCGNEDCPAEVWATTCDDPDSLDAVYEKVLEQ